MALYTPHSIFHLVRLLYVRPETFVCARAANVEGVRLVSINRGKHLVALSYLPLSPSVRMASYISAAPAGLIFVKFHIYGILKKICRKIPDLFKIWKQCVDKPTRCNNSYEWTLLFINWLYMFRTITSSSSGASSHILYNALVCSCRRV